MPLATRADMVAAFGEEELIQLTDRAGAGAIDDTVLDAALAAASDEALGWLPRDPLRPSPALVRHVCAIARFLLYKDAATEEVRMRYEHAMAWLRAASRGRARFDLADPRRDADAPVASSLRLPHESRRIPAFGPALGR